MELVRSEDTKAKIRASMSATKARRQAQVCRVFELKVSIRHNPKETFQKLSQCFKEAKWVINDMLSLSKDNPDNSMFDYKYTEHKDVVHYDKDKNPVTSTITLPSVLHRATVAQKKTDIVNLAKAKKKGIKVGALKFKSGVNCLPIITGFTQILDGCRITIPGFRKLRVHGLNQLHQFEKFELADAKLIHKASGYYVKISVMLPKEKRIPCRDHSVKESGFALFSANSSGFPVGANLTIYKKVAMYRFGVFLKHVVLELSVPALAMKRISLSTRKIRVSEAIPVKLYDTEMNPIKKPWFAKLLAMRDRKYEYRLGKVAKPLRKFDESTDECSSGIHGFIDPYDARTYSF